MGLCILLILYILLYHSPTVPRFSAGIRSSDLKMLSPLFASVPFLTLCSGTERRFSWDWDWKLADRATRDTSATGPRRYRAG